MRRRRLLLLGLVVVGLAGFAGVWVGWTARSPINEQNCKAIKVGMNRAQVEALLGGPPGNRTAHPVPYAACFSPAMAEGVDGLPFHWWLGDEGIVGVRYAREGTVLSTLYVPAVRPPVNLLARLRTWLPW